MKIKVTVSKKLTKIFETESNKIEFTRLVSIVNEELIKDNSPDILTNIEIASLEYDQKLEIIHFKEAKP